MEYRYRDLTSDEEQQVSNLLNNIPEDFINRLTKCDRVHLLELLHRKKLNKHQLVDLQELKVMALLWINLYGSNE